MGACRAEGLPDPELTYEEMGLWLTFRFKPLEDKTRVKTPERILQALEANPNLTLAQVAAAIGKSVSAVERASEKLMEERRLRYIGPKRGGHREVSR